jgi:hypothetical protein
MKKENRQEPPDKSVGTVQGAKTRAKANTLTAEEREVLLKRGLSMIYGGAERAKATTDRS